MYRDGIKIFSKNKNELETLRIFSQDIGMEFGIEKCAVPIKEKMKKRVKTKKIKMHKKESIRKGL